MSESSSESQHPGSYVREHVIPKGMSVTKAAEMMGIGRPALSNFLNGNSSLSPEMAARLQKAFGADADELMRLQTAYDARHRRSDTVSATTRSFVPPFLVAKADDIQGWADKLSSREQLAVLLRMLVHSTCDRLELVDFPGNDDAQRPGWDGRVRTTEGNPWVPQGTSCWEFGTNRDAARKANEDYGKRTAGTGEADRQRTTFVFVTPRRWQGKEAWVRDKRAEGKWRDVSAWDASDLEQWLEQSIPAQVWFAGRQGRTLRGVKPLERCWVEWCADCEPSLTRDMFAEAISAFGGKVVSHLRDQTQGILRIVADSRQEALAFIAVVLSQSEELTALADRVLVFTEPGVLSELAVGSPGFIPLITNSKVEAELAESGTTLTALVVDHQTAVKPESGISVEPLSYQGFSEALESMGLGRDEIDRLDRESGRSLTVLRRRLARNQAIRTPAWCADTELASSLAPMAFAGAWVATNDADRYLIGELAARDHEQLEDDFTRLRNLEDSPVWSVGDYRGVVSKLDALYGTRRWMSVDLVERFLDVADVVLSEHDPSLDLPEGKQWAASLYGKAREISSPLRKGIGESLVLLAVHGGRLFGDRMNPDPQRRVANLVGSLLEPMTTNKLLSQSSNLTLYAEAAPETFLGIFERDMAAARPVVRELMKPAGDIMFGRSDRVDLLWALELLAWRPEWLERVVDLLAQLAAWEPDDNLANKPSETLQSIFRARVPQTAAMLRHRIAILDRLAERHPDVAWRIAMAQFDRGQSIGRYAYKPIWRDYAVGCGGRVSDAERREFVLDCIDTCIRWPSHTRETLADVMANMILLQSSHLAELGDAVAAWSRGASDEDRAWLRERIRVSTRRSARRESEEKSCVDEASDHVLTAREAFDILEPQDSVWKHAWLFAKPWVEESWDEIEGDVDPHVRDGQIRTERGQAVNEVLRDSGRDGVLRLAFSGDAPNTVGESVSRIIQDEDELLSFVRTVIDDGDFLASLPHQSLISGLFNEMGPPATVSLVDALWPERGGDVCVMLLCLASFERPVWSRVEAIGGSVAGQYWAKVRPLWRRHSDDDLNYAVSQLLAANRPQAALGFAHLDWGHLESRHIHAILSELPVSDERHDGNARLDAYSIQRALGVLGERNYLAQAEMARLELLYLDPYRINDGGVPNLEREIEDKPELFAEAITVAYPRTDQDDDRDLTGDERNSVLTAQRLLRKLSCVPGHDDNGDLNAERVTDWIRKAQELCGANGRRGIGDHHIGQLLSNAPAGGDRVWPCEPVRVALDAVLNDDIETGFHIGRQNSRGAQWRGEGGAQERELAQQYEEWAKACDYSYPRVAAALRGLASAYRREGRWWDQEAAIQQRLGF